MTRWRDKLAKAKGRIHRTFEVPAVYLTHTAGIPVRTAIRVHDNIKRIENEFTWPNGPGLADLATRVIFDVTVVPDPASQAFVFVSADEVYRLGPSEKKRDGYIAVDVVPASEADIQSVGDHYDTVNGGLYGPEWDEIFP